MVLYENCELFHSFYKLYKWITELGFLCKFPAILLNIPKRSSFLRSGFLIGGLASGRRPRPAPRRAATTRCRCRCPTARPPTCSRAWQRPRRPTSSTTAPCRAYPAMPTISWDTPWTSTRHRPPSSPHRYRPPSSPHRYTDRTKWGSDSTLHSTDIGPRFCQLGSESYQQ